MLFSFLPVFSHAGLLGDGWEQAFFLLKFFPINPKKLCFLQVALNRTHLRYVMSFLPVARSSATLDYFHALDTDNQGGLIGDDRTEIVAMDLGLKDTLFNEYLMEDAIYLVLALTLISVAILAYTQSLFITIATLLAISYALALAYFIYTFVCGIKFFPFMNVLAAVIAIGESNFYTYYYSPLTFIKS